MEQQQEAGDDDAFDEKFEFAVPKWYDFQEEWKKTTREEVNKVRGSEVDRWFDRNHPLHEPPVWVARPPSKNLLLCDDDLDADGSSSVEESDDEVLSAVPIREKWAPERVVSLDSSFREAVKRAAQLKPKSLHESSFVDINSSFGTTKAERVEQKQQEKPQRLAVHNTSNLRCDDSDGDSEEDLNDLIQLHNRSVSKLQSSKKQVSNAFSKQPQRAKVFATTQEHGANRAASESDDDDDEEELEHLIKLHNDNVSHKKGGLPERKTGDARKSRITSKAKIETDPDDDLVGMLNKHNKNVQQQKQRELREACEQRAKIRAQERAPRSKIAKNCDSDTRKTRSVGKKRHADHSIETEKARKPNVQRGKVAFCAAASPSFQNPTKQLISKGKTKRGRSVQAPGKENEPSFDGAGGLSEIASLLNQHNKKIGKKGSTYIPRVHSTKDIREWEKRTGYKWCKLNATEKELVNIEIAEMKQTHVSRSLNNLHAI